MNKKISILQERISAEEYIDFLKRTDLGSQYPKERFVIELRSWSRLFASALSPEMNGEQLSAFCLA